MSSSPQEPATRPDDSDEMMETPDSPVETPFVPNSSNQSASLSKQQPGTSSRTPKAESSGKASHGAPGSTWQTKKFHEEYERSMSQLLHQDWDPAKYGDPLMQ